jgi:hypothetical protein
MLPTALSEALGISLSEVLDRYYNGLDEVERVHLIGDALDRKRMEEEGEEWLAEEAWRRLIELECIHQGRDSADSF